MSFLSPQTTVLVCSFPAIEPAVRSTIEMLQAGVPVARVEFLDELSLEAANKYSHLSYPVLPTLFIELTGSPQSVEEQTEIVGKKNMFNCIFCRSLIMFFVKYLRSICTQLKVNL